MIVPMKKVYIVMLEKESSTAIRDLASLGLFHVEQQAFPQSERIQELQKELSLINMVLKILEKGPFLKPINTEKFQPTLWQRYALHILDLDKRIFQLQEYKEKLLLEIDQYQDWGDFDPEEILKFKEKGIYFKFYFIPKNEIKTIPKEFFVQKIFSKGAILGCLIIGYKKEPILNFKEIPLPKMALSKIYKRLEETEKTKQELTAELLDYIQFKEEFLNIKYSLEEELLFLQTILGMKKIDSLVYLVGYVPYDQLNPLKDLVRKNAWAILIKDPAPEDKVPTLLRNPKWLKIIEPIFKFLELLPGYDELDISFLFLIFFSLFFGIIIGDAGYGLVYLGLTYFFHKKFNKKIKDKNIFSLFYLLSLTAILWGVLSGTFFGQGLGLKAVLPFLRNNISIQRICLLLGFLHLSIAHLWRAILRFPQLSFLSELGWVSILAGSFYLASCLVLGEAWSGAIKWFYLGGSFCVIFFSFPSKNIFLSVMKGLGNIFSNLVSTFTDLISYIRLFAVGMATLAVADAFHQMAVQFGFTGFIKGLIGSLILVLGPLLNILLGPMSVLVHGIRLNVLEFSNHLDLKWKGFAYQPLMFKKLKEVK